MAHFMCEIQGMRGDASRLGSKSSGVRAKVRSWSGDAQLHLDHEPSTGTDTLRFTLRPEHGYERTVFVLDDYGALLRAIAAKDPKVLAALDALNTAAADVANVAYKTA
jgi:hypothetical protein